MIPLDAGDGRAAARTVAGITDLDVYARVWRRAQLIVMWTDFVVKD